MLRLFFSLRIRCDRNSKEEYNKEITAVPADLVERETQDQAKSKVWFSQRAMRTTASILRHESFHLYVRCALLWKKIIKMSIKKCECVMVTYLISSTYNLLSWREKKKSKPPPLSVMKFIWNQNTRAHWGASNKSYKAIVNWTDRWTEVNRRTGNISDQGK